MSIDALDLHLKTGTTDICRCWRLTRRDGDQFGFTDHDCDLEFEGTVFQAGTGLTAAALSQTTGLSVDNTEAIGALSDAAITERDIFAGRFDGAQIEAWLVQWSAPENRVVQFRGALGEITRASGAFSAELRGLAEQMNVPNGRIYQRSCSAVLGDQHCGFDLASPGYQIEATVIKGGLRTLRLGGGEEFEPRWFERGALSIIEGVAIGLSGAIKKDQVEGSFRHIELWDSLKVEVKSGDRVRLTAGCDKRMETCRLKFGNLLNFRGFPDIPSEDWQMAHPTRMSNRSGGSRR